MEPMNFKSLNVINPIIRASTEAGFGRPTDMQRKVIPKIFLKKDIFCQAENDGKKTASFAIPVIQMMKKNMVDHRNIRVLVISANDENVMKTSQTFDVYSEYLPISKSEVMNGELNGSDIWELKKGPDIVIATPEKLYSLILQGHCDFSKVEMLIIDDVSALEKAGLMVEISAIIQRLPLKAQLVFYSRKLTETIQKFAQKYLKSPVEINIPQEFSVKKNAELPILFIRDHSEMISDHITGTSNERSLAF